MINYKNNIFNAAQAATVNSRPDTDSYFSSAYIAELNLSADQASAIQSFFESVTNNKASARILATSVINTALSQNINPMSVLADFQKRFKDSEQLDVYLTTFLNFARANSSLLGISNTPGVSIFVSRSVLP